MASKKQRERAADDLDTEKCLGSRPKLTAQAGMRAMRERIAHLETELAALDVQMSKAEDPQYIQSLIARSKEMRADLQEAQTRLEEYNTQHEGRN